jgi:ribosomal-protein-alanine N-acetyltransferase
MPEIETGRLRLRMFTLEDLDELARIFGNPDVMQYIGASGGPITRAETEHALLSIIKHWHRHGIGRWAAEYKQEKKLIGYGGLRRFEHEGEGKGRPELVYL